MDPGLFVFHRADLIRRSTANGIHAGRHSSDRAAVNSPAEWRRWVILKKLPRVAPLTGGATDSQNMQP